MKAHCSALLLLTLAAIGSATAQTPAPSPSATPAPGSDPAPARSKALELAGAFANDGYKNRDGFWAATLEPGKPLFLEVNVFSGNEYWFSAAAVPPARAITVSLFDAGGRPVEGEIYYKDGPCAAAGFIAAASGRCFVRVELTEGEKADFCLIYSYK